MTTSQSTTRRIFNKIVAAASFSMAMLCGPISVGAAEEINLTAVGGGVGGGWYSTLGSLAGIINADNPNIQIRVVPGGGLSNPATIGEGVNDIGWVYPSFAKAALTGENPYDQKYDGIRAVIGGFSPTVLHLMVTEKSGIGSFEEIVQKKMPARILTGRKSTTPAWFFDKLLEHYGTTVADIESWGGSVTYTAYGDWSQLIQDGHVDVMFDQIAVPSPILGEMQVSQNIKVLSLAPDVREKFAEMFSLTSRIIPKDTYKNQSEDVLTLSMFTALAANNDVSEEAVYSIARTMIQQADNVRAIHPSFSEFEPAAAWQSLGVPLHPGAIRAFEEAGISVE